MRRDRTWRERLWRDLRVHLYFLRVVLPQFKLSFGLFFVANLIGALVIWEAWPGMSFPRALWASLALTFLEISEPFPEGHGVVVQATYFLLPAVGLTVIAEGLVRFGVVVFNRKQMTVEWHMALAASFKDHVVVAGMGKIGTRVVQRLMEGEERLVCIDRSRDVTAALNFPPEVAVIQGEATQPDVQAKANMVQARALLALTDNDMANLEMALNARELNPKLRVVLRMSNENLGRRMVKQFGFEAFFSTTALAAPSFASALYSNRILQTIEVGPERSVHLAQATVAAGSSLVGRTILDVEREAEVSVVLHISHGQDSLLPKVEACVNGGDRLYVLAELKRLDRFDHLATAAQG
jgi:voltage-gated potassium channel